MTLTLELPDDVAEKLTAAYPDEAERNRALMCSIIDTLGWEQQDRAEMIEIINEELAATAAGDKGYTLDEAWQRLDEMKAEYLKTRQGR